MKTKWIGLLAWGLGLAALLASCQGLSPVTSAPADSLAGTVLPSTLEPSTAPGTIMSEPITPTSLLPSITTGSSLPSESIPQDTAQPFLAIDTGLPVFYLEVDLAAVYSDRDTYQPCSVFLRQDRDNPDRLPVGPFQAEVKGRGNSSWQDDKRSFHVQLDAKMNLLGLGENKHWLLLGQSSDLTLMKNKLFYDLSGAMGLVYMQSDWVELVINNQHLGNYLLCEKINHSDNLALPTGLIYELDSNFDEDYRFKTTNGQPIMIHTHKYLDELDEPTLETIQARLQSFENAVVSPDFTTAFQGRRTRYNDLIDLESLVDYWLVQELSCNPSMFKNSTYFYQQSLDSVYQMGPVWDMDQSTGDLERQYPGYDRWGSTLWGNITESDSQTRAWPKYFIHDPVFLAAAYRAYWDNHDRFAELVAEKGTIFQMREQLLPSAIRNYQIWQNETDGEEAKDDYKALVRTLKAWLTNRIAWLDRQFESEQTLKRSLETGGF